MRSGLASQPRLWFRHRSNWPVLPAKRNAIDGDRGFSRGRGWSRSIRYRNSATPPTTSSARRDSFFERIAVFAASET
jgi:hypothetical protein